jgi:23S rRNA (guanine1835-N2)-methyltransferase
MDRMRTGFGEFDLARFPANARDQLRAWDAADEYLLAQVESLPAATLDGCVVVANDSWGALATALSSHRPRMISDSTLSQTATVENLTRNHIAADTVTLSSCLEAPPATIDVLLMRVPKSLALLEYQLHSLASSVHANTVIVATGMVKQIHRSTLDLFEQTLGPTRTSLAAKKARLIFCTADSEVSNTVNPWPQTYPLPGDVGELSGRLLTQHAGVFSAGRLDPGTRLLLQNLPTSEGPQEVVDLGCGNGVLGLSVALSNKQAHLTFVDESHLAVDSARTNFTGVAGDHRPATFLVRPSLQLREPADPITASSVDLILNNPPFHSDRSRTDETAWRMFSESRIALRTGGELWVVGNRHLGYHAKLSRLFGNCEVIASSAKFVVLRAVAGLSASRVDAEVGQHRGEHKRHKQQLHPVPHRVAPESGPLPGEGVAAEH